MANSSLFSPFTVDRFASPDSAKYARFYSKFWRPGAEGVDTFSVDWAGENNWLVPPIYLISRTIFHLEGCNNWCSIFNDFMLIGFPLCIFIDIFSTDLRFVIICIPRSIVFCFIAFLV